MPATESVAQHTPGPWKLITDSEIDGEYGSARRSVWPHGIQSSDGSWVVRDGWDDDYGTDQMADARLMAAAPDLLAAVQMARAYFLAAGDIETDTYAALCEAEVKAVRG